MNNIEENFDLIIDLWKNFNLASSMLTKAIGGTSNEVGEFAEILTAKYYKGTKLPASSKSSDIELKDGRKVQVKARKIKSLDIIPTKLSVFRNWNFDILVVILFDINGSIMKAIEIDSLTAQQLAKEDHHQNGMCLTTNNKLLNHKNAKDITQDLQNMIENKTVISVEKQKKDELSQENKFVRKLGNYEKDEFNTVKQRILNWNLNSRLICYKIIAILFNSKYGLDIETFSSIVDKKTKSKNPKGAIRSLMTSKGNAFGKVFIEVDGVIKFAPEIYETVSQLNWIIE